MATITKPAAPGWKGVSARYRKVKSRFPNPFTLQTQTQIWSGEQWVFDLTLPPMSQATAAAWMAFLHELARDNDNFSLVCANYVPAGVTSPRLVRLVGNEAAWDINDAMMFGISFTVEDDI